ncbi:hypothetical protein GOBAR_DD04153 [Gossypium barbadense]|nr:hypothetical protein GOBAR_DD04153 [Gossypium barbadense]
MGESGGSGREKRDDISLLTKELIQLSVNGSMVVPSENPSLICTIWIEKLYNPESFKAQMRSIWKTKKKFEIQTVGQNLYLIVFELEEDLELIMEGRPWLFRKSLILFDRLNQSVERSQIRLHSSSFWLKIGPCLPEFDKKDLLHSIGVTFGGVLKSEIGGEWCRLRINLNVQKPLRRVGHGLLDCSEWNPAEKLKIKEDPPYTLALKAESNAIGKESIKFNDLSKKNRVQCSYTRSSEMEVMNGIIQGGLQPRGDEELREDHEEAFKVMKNEQRDDTKNRQIMNPHDDYLAWRGESSGEFTVRSAYKLLHGIEFNPRAYTLQNECRKFYKELWLLNLPTKLKITVWRISWNYLPTWVNLQHRRLLNNTACSWCGRAVETTNHIFHECPGVTSIWKELSFPEILQVPYMEFFQWLTWIFEQISPSRRRIFCCALWAIWGERNKRVHEKTIRSGKEIAKFIKSYISELVGIKEKTPKVIIGNQKWKHPPDQFVKINFDAEYDGNLNQSDVGIVARDSEGNVLLSFTEVHKQVASAFAAEAIACRSATQIGIDMQWAKIIIEGDALSIIKKCKMKSQDRSMIGAFIYDIHQIMIKSSNISFEYIPREGNSLAHSLAEETLKRKDEIYLIGGVPEYAEHLKDRDKDDRMD